MAQKNRIEIIYCPLCHWLPRSAWMAQELLYTFAEELTEVALKPSPEGGAFVIRLDGETIWDRETDGGFPDVKQLKQRVRDRVNPERNLGHLEP